MRLLFPVLIMGLGPLAILCSCVQQAGSPSISSADPSGAPNLLKGHAPMMPPPKADGGAPADLDGLHNVVAYSDGLYCGSVPDSDRGFETLKALGVTTVISVDGARPDIEAAKAQGLRYIHLPIGYNGMDRDRTLEIARAIQIADGPVYVHCHHGKHRSAGATGAAAVTLGLISNAVAEQRMKVSGTAPSYTGLYQCAAVARQVPQAELDLIPKDLPEVWKTSDLIQAMVEIEHAIDHLKLIQNGGWTVPADHPDLVPVAEAGRLADLFRNLEDDEKVKEQPAEFTQWLLASSADSEKLEGTLTKNQIPAPAAELSAMLAKVERSCKECHVKYRD